MIIIVLVTTAVVTLMLLSFVSGKLADKAKKESARSGAGIDTVSYLRAINSQLATGGATYPVSTLMDGLRAKRGGHPSGLVFSTREAISPNKSAAVESALADFFGDIEAYAASLSRADREAIENELLSIRCTIKHRVR